MVSKLLIIRIASGLGNQLFSYAFAWKLAQDLDRKLVIDTSEYKLIKERDYLLDKFTGPSTVEKSSGATGVILLVSRALQHFSYRATRIFLRMFGIHWIHCINIDDFKEKMEHGELSPRNRVVYLSGTYWGDISLLPKRESIKAEYRLLTSASAIDGTSESVSVHIRRSDFTRWSLQLPMTYYHNAMAEMKQHVSKPHWYFFSDEIQWCREMFRDCDNATFVEGDINDPTKEFELMSKCKHHIIANSSFSWWAAYLSSDGFTICPERYMYHLKSQQGLNIPSDWIIVK